MPHPANRDFRRAETRQLTTLYCRVPTQLHEAGSVAREVLDIVSYNTLIKSAARRGDVHKCFELLDMIQAAQLEADDVTFSTLLDVCIDREEHELASQVQRASAHRAGAKELHR